MIDFSENPVIDAHCHPFLPEKESRPFEAYLTLSDLPQKHEDLTSTMLYRQVMRELGRLLRLKGETRIIEERQRRIKSDPSSYINTLFDDAGIEALLVDSGYPFKEFTGYEIDLGDFSEMIGREAHEIFRLEVAVYGLLKGLVPFDDAAEDMRTQVREAVRGGVVALKSIVAYRTGLEYRAWDEGMAKRSWEEMTGLVREGRKPGEVLAVRNERNKSIYDTFLMVGIEEAGRLDVPIQIHTGMGDSPSMDLRLANPAQLYNLLQDERTRKAKLVLTHGGYPYVEEAAFLINAYPNVYLDFSETIPFTSVGTKSRFLSLLEMAPTTKIMYGSDGFNVPEIHWFAAIQTRRALAAVLGELTEHGECSEEEVLRIGGDFLADNARRLYRL